ncbi:MAG: DNA recombination protein RmuC [Phycisphaerales bacterium]|nr:DNA recombination protein RmuC [Phycisphaerales bacterium]MCB9862187.1 DNA recombination protein RmuC [Phycisphaerales bacterium]
MEALWIIAGLAIGGATGAYVGFLRGRAGASREAAGLAATLEEVRSRLGASDDERSALQEAVNKERVANAEAQARLDAAREHFAEQRRQIAEMETKLKESFEALSARALDRNNDRFGILAEEKLKPLREQLKTYEANIKLLEEKRATAYGDIAQRLVKLDEGREKLGAETRQLAAALRQPGAKGRWGEVGLRNVVELSGMSAFCDYDEQVSIQGDSGTLRPDLTVRLPGGGILVVDAKVNISAYLDAVEATDDESRQKHLTKYLGDVRTTLNALSKKDYSRLFDKAPEFVVMFMPAEAFFAAAVAEDKHLVREAIEKRVLMASPSTLAALLMAIRQGWQQQDIAENAVAISRAGRELYDRLCKFTGDLEGIRKGLEKASDSYNRAIGSWERRAIPGVRKLMDLGARTAKDLPESSPLHVPLRQLTSIEDDDVDTIADQASGESRQAS